MPAHDSRRYLSAAPGNPFLSVNFSRIDRASGWNAESPRGGSQAAVGWLDHAGKKQVLWFFEVDHYRLFAIQWINNREDPASNEIAAVDKSPECLRTDQVAALSNILNGGRYGNDISPRSMRIS